MERHTLLVDQKTGTMRLLAPHDDCDATHIATCGTPIARGQRIPLPSGSVLGVRVVNANTVFYDYSCDTTVVAPAPETQPLRSLLGLLKLYLPELAYARNTTRSGFKASEGARQSRLFPAFPAGVTTELQRAVMAGRALETALVDFDQVLAGPKGIEPTSLVIVEHLERLRTGADPAATAELRANLAPDTGAVGAFAPLTIARFASISRARAELAESYAELSPYEVTSSIRDSIVKVRALADSAVARAQQTVDVAYRMDQMVARLLAGKNEWASPGATVRLNESRTLTLTITPRTEPEIARVASPRSSFSVIATPRLGVRAIFGASFTFATGATFPVYGARTVGPNAQIFEQGRKDNRFLWAAQFGLSWPLATLGRQRIGVVAPELSFNPTTDARAVGAGAGLSLGVIKLTAGAMFVRHSALLGQSVGDVVPSKDFLRVRDTYGSPTLYLSIAVAQWPFGQ